MSTALISSTTLAQRGRPGPMSRRMAAGIAAIELALLLPVLVLLAVPIFDIARLIQADIILENMSREGANLASRTSDDAQTIMNGISATSPPLTMGPRGMIYITKVMGNKESSAVRNVVVQQDKWRNGGNTAKSNLWPGCGSWTAGQCSSIPSNPDMAPTAPIMTGQLLDGEVIYVVEVFYKTQFLFGAMDLGAGVSTPLLNPDLYAQTIF